MSTIRLPGSLGTDTIRQTAKSIILNLKIDRDGDGKVEANEIASAIAGIIPALLNGQDLLAEVRDYTKEELDADIQWLVKELPAFSPFRPTINAVLTGIAATVNGIIQTVSAVKKLKKTAPDPNLEVKTQGDEFEGDALTAKQRKLKGSAGTLDEENEIA